MNAPQLIERLIEASKDEDDFQYALDEIAAELPQDEKGLDLVTPILQFMEQHSTLDFGSPGALTHYVEKFYQRGYEDRLIESVSRRPVIHTLFMLNRLINGTKEPQKRAHLIALIREVLGNPMADEDTREIAERYLERHAMG